MPRYLSPANKFLVKFDNRNTRKRCKICWQLIWPKTNRNSWYSRLSLGTQSSALFALHLLLISFSPGSKLLMLSEIFYTVSTSWFDRINSGYFKNEISQKFFVKSRGRLFSFWCFIYYTITALNVSVFGVILVLIFPHSDWIRRDTKYLWCMITEIK